MEHMRQKESRKIEEGDEGGSWIVVLVAGGTAVGEVGGARKRASARVACKRYYEGPAEGHSQAGRIQHYMAKEEQGSGGKEERTEREY